MNEKNARKQPMNENKESENFLKALKVFKALYLWLFLLWFSVRCLQRLQYQ